MRLRPEIPDDAGAIEMLTRAAFDGAPHAGGTEYAIPGRLRDAGALRLSLVAEEAGAIFGHVAFSPVTINGDATDWLALGPVSVAPERQRQGIGRRLIVEGLDLMRREGAAGCIVLGDPAYYGRFGFVAVPWLTWPPAEARYLQRIVLSGPDRGGTVAFHPAFG